MWAQRSKDARDGKLGPLLPKNDESAAKYRQGPQPIETTLAQTEPDPSPIKVPQVSRGGWSTKYHITTTWSGTLNAGGMRATVYAGSKSDDPGRGDKQSWGAIEQGVVIIEDITQDVGKIIGDYISPTRMGMLTIVSYNGTCLGLKSTDGTMYTFDVAAQSWECKATP